MVVRSSFDDAALPALSHARLSVDECMTCRNGRVIPGSLSEELGV